MGHTSWRRISSLVKTLKKIVHLMCVMTEELISMIDLGEVDCHLDNCHLGNLDARARWMLIAAREEAGQKSEQL